MRLKYRTFVSTHFLNTIPFCFIQSEKNLMQMVPCFDLFLFIFKWIATPSVMINKKNNINTLRTLNNLIIFFSQLSSFCSKALVFVAKISFTPLIPVFLIKIKKRLYLQFNKFAANL